MHQFNHKLKAKSMNPDTRRQQGATLIVGVLILMLIVVGVFIIASNFMLTGRRTTGDQTSTMHAQYAADSGIAYADASFSTLKEVLERPIIPQSGGKNVTIAEFKTSLAKLCTSSPSATQWDYAKNTDSTTVRPVNGVKGSMLGKSVCQVKETPAEGDLDFFFKYYPKETAGFVNSGITTDADAKDFLKKSLIAGSTSVEYGEGVQQRSSRMLEPIWLTTIKTGTYRLYFKIPDFESTGTFAKSTRKKVMSSTKTLYYLQIELPPGGRTDLFAYKVDKQYGARSGVRHEYNEPYSNNNAFDCRDYFEGPVHTNEYFRVDPYSCQSETATTTGQLTDGYKPEIALTGKALSGPVINGKFTSASCVKTASDETKCDPEQTPNSRIRGFAFTMEQIGSSTTDRLVIPAQTSQEPQKIGDITSLTVASTEKIDRYLGVYGSGLDSDNAKFNWLPSVGGFGVVSNGAYTRYGTPLSSGYDDSEPVNIGIKKSKHTYGIITGIDALATALNDKYGTSNVVAPKPVYNDPYSKMTAGPKDITDYDDAADAVNTIENDAGLKGIHIASRIDRLQLSTKELSVNKVENGRDTGQPHSIRV